MLPKDARVLKDSKTAPEGVVTKKIPYIWEKMGKRPASQKWTNKFY